MPSVSVVALTYLALTVVADTRPDHSQSPTSQDSISIWLVTTQRLSSVCVSLYASRPDCFTHYSPPEIVAVPSVSVVALTYLALTVVADTRPDYSYQHHHTVSVYGP